MNTPQSDTLRGPPVSLRFTGYATLWDRVDRAGDVMRRGAFADGEAPLLWQHRGAPVGRVTAATDTIGLRVTGEIESREIANMVRSGGLDGLSIGYRTRVSRQGAWREIVAADLIEVSLVAQPMQPGARVIGTVADPDQREKRGTDSAGDRFTREPENPAFPIK